MDSARSVHGFIIFSLLDGILTCLKTRAFGDFNKVHSTLAAGLDGMAGCGIMTGDVIVCRTLSLTFEAIDAAEY